MAITTNATTTIALTGCYIVEQINGLARALPIVLDEDERIHTAANGYRCDDPTCPCNASEPSSEQDEGK